MKDKVDYKILYDAYDSVAAIKMAREKLKEARKIRCTCSSFVLQYEGSCQCKRGSEISMAESVLNNLINRL